MKFRSVRMSLHSLATLLALAVALLVLEGPRPASAQATYNYSCYGTTNRCNRFGNGEADGHSFADGSRYRGMWRDSIPHGTGKILYKDGCVFEGSLKAGKITGQGTITMKGGESWSGRWEQGVPVGTGTHTLKNGTVKKNTAPSSFVLYSAGYHSWNARDYVPARTSFNRAWSKLSWMTRGNMGAVYARTLRRAAMADLDEAIAANGGEASAELYRETRTELLKALAVADGAYSKDSDRLVAALRNELQAVDELIDVEMGDGGASRAAAAREALSSGRDAYKRRDWETALPLLMSAYQGGHAEAGYYLGDMYFHNYGLFRSYSTAERYLREHLRDGRFADAPTHVGEIVMKGLGTADRDYEEAVELFKLGAAQGSRQAFVFLGDMYRKGTGVPADTAEAVRWLSGAAERGHTASANYLGVIFTANGPHKNDQEAVRLFRLAADEGHAKATYNLAIMTSKGRGTEKDCLQAIRLFRKAAELGDKTAAEKAEALLDGGC